MSTTQPMHVDKGSNLEAGNLEPTPMTTAVALLGTTSVSTTTSINAAPDLSSLFAVTNAHQPPISPYPFSPVPYQYMECYPNRVFIGCIPAEVRNFFNYLNQEVYFRRSKKTYGAISKSTATYVN